MLCMNELNVFYYTNIYIDISFHIVDLENLFIYFYTYRIIKLYSNSLIVLIHSLNITKYCSESQYNNHLCKSRSSLSRLSNVMINHTFQNNYQNYEY